MTEQIVHTAAIDVHPGWNFETPPISLRSSKMQLLTIGGVAVIGHWYGGFGQYFVGWAPLLKVPKDVDLNALIAKAKSDGKRSAE